MAAMGLSACGRRAQPAASAAIEGPIDLVAIGPYPQNLLVAPSGVHLVRGPALPRLAGRLESWFERPVRTAVRDAEDELEALTARERDGLRQLDAPAVLEWVDSWRRSDAACTLAITIEDLYDQGAQWVFGFADIDRRVGIHSLLRYDPGFPNPDERPADWSEIVWSRALRVALHETEHLLGLPHCRNESCLMNETAGIADVDAAPLSLCRSCQHLHETARG